MLLLSAVSGKALLASANNLQGFLRADRCGAKTRAVALLALSPLPLTRINCRGVALSVNLPKANQNGSGRV